MANRPKPTALRELNGNAGKRPLPKGEPKPALAETAPPEWLPSEAVEFWAELSPMLVAGRVLTEFDRVALVALSAAYALWRESYDHIQAEGSWYETSTKMGDTIIRRHPASVEEAERWKRLRLMLIEFGMTPAARSRVAKAGEDGAEDDPVAKWLNG